MATAVRQSPSADDPREIREHLARTTQLAQNHGLPSVIVGVAGPESDLMVPDLIDFVASALRVEDAIFRLTRERALLFLADVENVQAERIVERLIADFLDRFPAVAEPPVALTYFQVTPGCGDLLPKDVLPSVFPAPSSN